MSRCLRYRNLTICDHLASQYVAGSLSFRVRARIEKLVETVPELERAIANWSDNFSPLHEHMLVDISSKNVDTVWSKIDKQIEHYERKTQKQANAESGISLFNQLFAWKVSTAFASLVAAVFAALLLTTEPDIITKQTGPDYLANMTIHNDDVGQVQFVITVYGKTEQAPSKLHVQWSKNRSESLDVSKTLHLWAEDRDTGQLTYIGIEPEKGQSWNLTKPTWKAIANSSRLLMTKEKEMLEDNIVFSGDCLQLKSWKS